jgi:hypothetical protein
VSRTDGDYREVALATSSAAEFHLTPQDVDYRVKPDRKKRKSSLKSLKAATDAAFGQKAKSSGNQVRKTWGASQKRRLARSLP